MNRTTLLLIPWLLGWVGLLILDTPAKASDFCVDSAVTLQNALLRAASNGQDDEINLVQGIYFGNFEYSSIESKALSIRGGYSQDCASRALDPSNTLLDGQQIGPVLAISGPEEGAEFTIEGMTLQHGKATADSVGKGGGLSVNGGTKGSVTVRHNQVMNNSGVDGGGAYLLAGTISLNFNSIQDNESSGGHWGGGGAMVLGSVDVTNNRIQGNTSTRCGGGILLASSHAILTDNLIQNNSGQLGGGICLLTHHSTAWLSSNLTNNNLANEGGGLALYGSKGGAILLEANKFQDNLAATRGGGIFVGSDYIDATLINNSLVGNTAREGGGYFGQGSYGDTNFTNNTLIDNASYSGGGLSLYLDGPMTDSRVNLFNNLFRYNQAVGKQGEDFWIANATTSQVALYANNFNWSSPAGYWVKTPVYVDATNLNALDPQFVDVDHGDLRLLAGSPMIDVGYLLTPDLPDFDLSGRPRVRGDGVDIGAYESDASDPGLTLTLVHAGTGSGHVTSEPRGLNCVSGAGDCSWAFARDTVVSLSAAPTDATSEFTGWGGDTDCTDGRVTMTWGLGCTATFTAVQQLRVTIDGRGTGTVTSEPVGLSCSESCRHPFPQGQSVKLTARAAEGSRLTGWTGDASCPNPLLDSDRTCIATFEPILYPLLVMKAGMGTGTVTSQDGLIQCGNDCREDYATGTSVTLTANPTDPSIFGGWSGACTGNNPICEVTPRSVLGVSATFTSPQYPLIISTIGAGSGTVTVNGDDLGCGVECGAIYPVDAQITLTPHPEPGSIFSGWTGACVGSGDCKLTMDQVKTVNALFNLETFTLTVLTSGNGAGSIGGEGDYAFNTIVNPIAIPADGSILVGWEPVICGAAFALTKDVSCTAIFSSTPPPKPLVVFSESFEGTQFAELWGQDNQHNWVLSKRLATDGTHSAQIHGPALDAQLISVAINPQGATKASIKFDWYLDSHLSPDENLAFDLSINGGTTWTEMAKMTGSPRINLTNNYWHKAQFELTDLVARDNLRLRFRGTLSGSIGAAYLDNISVTVQ